jgi:putative hydrolases of HD superfamily
MKAVADLFFEAKMLKEIPRAGYHFLGIGKESVAEHCFSTSFIAYVMSRMQPGIDSLRLISMCLVHDLAEARTGDLNYVQKKYVKADESKAIADATRNLPFGDDIKDLMREFNAQETLESRLAHDADQISFVLDLKMLSDTGGKTPEKWLPFVVNRLKTDLGKKLAGEITSRNWDAWWNEGYTEDDME